MLSLARQKLKVADWIEKGLKTKGFREDHGQYIVYQGVGRGCGCALGAAMVGKFGDIKKAEDMYFSKVRHVSNGAVRIARVLGVFIELALKVNDSHSYNRIEAYKIAKTLRAEAKAEMKKAQAK